MQASPPRRTQGARSEETQRRLLEATIALLLERGYTRLTTPDIARRAGVSRGALTHHFANKEDIVVRAVANQLERVTAGLRAFCDDCPPQQMNTDTVVDYLWSMMAKGLFYVTLEYLPEARANDQFRQQLLPVVQEFHAALDAIWTRLSDHYGVAPDEARISMNTTMCLFRGMIAQTVLREDPDYFRRMLDYWKTHLRTSLGGKRSKEKAA
ncbi:TetR/AcrR family transcriptional regulator [Acetobacteraceae bacterium H6797]|nr:TetR/AcrR family transcriptional regulator [Acetobacteraceae bacterium H6797]